MDQSPTGPGRDVIADFAPGFDRIDLSALAPGLSLIGRATFSVVAGQACFGPAAWTLFIAVTGHGAADTADQRNGVVGLAAADLIP